MDSPIRIIHSLFYLLSYICLINAASTNKGDMDQEASGAGSTIPDVKTTTETIITSSTTTVRFTTDSNSTSIIRSTTQKDISESPPSDSNLTPLEMVIIISCAIIVTVLFIAYFMYIILKDRKFSGRMTLIRLNSASGETDESTLYMVDYDEVDINHGKLIMNAKE